MNQIDLRRIDLNLLVVFSVLMDECSVTRAATKLARTQSAVSHALARLREQVGDPLLVKVGGRMTASPRAQALIAEVRPLLGGLGRALAAPVAFDPATSTRTFRVAVPDFATALFPQVAQRIRAQAPLATLEWVRWEGGSMMAIAEGLIDVASAPTVMSLPEGIAHSPAGAFEWATFARRDHPALRAWGRQSWAKWPHVAVRLGDSVQSPVDVAAGAPVRRIAVWVPHFSAVAPLIASTDLLATLPIISMRDSLEAFKLVAMAVPHPIRPMSQRIVWSTRLIGDTSVCWIRDLFRDVFSKVLADATLVRVRRSPHARATVRTPTHR